MTRFAAAVAAAGLLLALPLATPAAADPLQLAQADVRISVDRPGYSDYGRHRRWHRDHRRCTTKVIIRDGRRTVIKRCRG